MELIQKLESLSGPLNGVEAWNLAHEGPWGSSSAETQLFAKALEGSLDAALALAERVRVAPYTGPITLTIAGSGQAYIDHSDPCGMGVQAFGNTPALALCLAILKANHKDKP